jgi:hypothetical protein
LPRCDLCGRASPRLSSTTDASQYKWTSRPQNPYHLTSAASELIPELPDAGGFVLRSIFVNYRRNDSEGEAGRLFDELAKHFGEHAVFMDVAAIEPGQDFRKAIDQSVADCCAFLAVIGPQWLGSQDASGGRRLSDPGDFVRIELDSALRSGTPVIPVLVRGSKMPRADELPDDLKDLAYRNAVELTHARWKSDIQVLLKALKPHMEPPAGSASSVSPAEKPAIPSAETPPRQTAVRNVEIRATSAPLEAPSVERATRELARYLGPIANVIVKRAAQRCSSIDELYFAVSREISSEADRANFIRSCRS